MLDARPKALARSPRPAPTPTLASSVGLTAVLGGERHTRQQTRPSLDSPTVRVEVTTEPPAKARADLEALGLFEGEQLPQPYAELAGAGDVRAAFRKLTLLRPDPERRLLVVGLGKRTELEPERLRVAAALSVAEAGRYDARTLAWTLPEAPQAGPAELAAGLTDGAVLASFRFDRFKPRDPSDPPPARLERLVLAVPNGAGQIEPAVAAARVSSEAANRARELQALPSNVVTPSYLADRAREIAGGHEALSAAILDRAEVAELGMGGLTAVARGKRRGAAADHASLRAIGRRPGRRSGWSARRSPSTPAGSRSSPRPRWRR